MYHSITFGNKNTWTDWHLVPSSRPVVAPPKPKTQYVDIPGADGSIDLTESLAGRPVYADREGSFEFTVLNDYDIYGYSYNWVTIYSSVLQHLHGKSMRMILEDDPNYYYEGRFSVNAWKSNANNSTITIDYRVSPYKYLVSTQFTTSDLELGTFGTSGTEGQSGYSINEVSTNLTARLKAPPRTYSNGDSIKFDLAYRFDIALYSGTAANPVSEHFITYSQMSSNSYKFSGSGLYRFCIYKPDSYSGVAVTNDDLVRMAATTYFYTGGIL